MITTKQLAKESGKTRRWIQVLCEQGTIKSKRYGHAYLIERADADAWLAGEGEKEVEEDENE